MTAIHHIPTTL